MKNHCCVMACALGAWLAGSLQASPSNNRAPSIRFSRPALARPSGESAYFNERVTFSVTARDPDGDALTLFLRNPPAGMTFAAVHGPNGVASGEVSFVVQGISGGLQHLLFEAVEDANHHRRGSLYANLRIEGPSFHQATTVADIDADGVLDVIAGGRSADVRGVVDAGALYVWLGSEQATGTPDATLTAPIPSTGDLLGDASGQGYQVGDVTGDGLFDIIAVTASGTAFVWAGDADFAGVRSPTATLRWPGTMSAPTFAGSGGQGFQLADVTGDGTLDILIGCPDADVNGVPSAGGIALWEGGSELEGDSPATSLLFNPTAGANDRIGFVEGQGIQVFDVTGDGIRDVIASSGDAHMFRGEIYVWKGGSSWNPTTPPTARLNIGAEEVFQRTGNERRGVQVADVSGDGVPDILASTAFADHSGVANAGQIYAWRGGAPMSGDVSPWSVMRVAEAATSDNLTDCNGQGYWLRDVTGDGVDDVIAGTTDVLGSGFSRGAIYVWKGGVSLAGVQDAYATLRAPPTSSPLPVTPAEAVRFVDFDGDGVLDIVAGTGNNDFTFASTRLHLWLGGPTLVGVSTPTSTLAAADDHTYDNSGDVLFEDVDGDGKSDVIGTSPSADHNGLLRSGVVNIWMGGSPKSGLSAPDIVLASPLDLPFESLGSAGGRGTAFEDVTGDGNPDMIVASFLNVYVWDGTALSNLAPPTAILQLASGAAIFAFGSGQALTIGDLDGDGFLDLAVPSRSADTTSATGAGAIFAWRGGPSLVGPAFATELLAPNAASNDRLGSASGQGHLLVDFRGRNRLGILGAASLADVGGAQDAGALYMWPLPFTAPPDMPFRLTVPGAKAGDRLGF